MITAGRIDAITRDLLDLVDLTFKELAFINVELLENKESHRGRVQRSNNDLNDYAPQTSAGVCLVNGPGNPT